MADELKLELTQRLKVVAINLSNHPSDKWSQEQRDAFYSLATKDFPLGGVDFQIIDVPFPNVAPNLPIAGVRVLATETLRKLMDYNYKYIMVQGEFTLTFMLVYELLKQGKVPVVATTERIVEEKGGQKISTFKFCNFRQYDII